VRSGLNSCWLWTGNLIRGWAGYFSLYGEHDYAYRWAYRLTYGPIPTGYEVHHKCLERGCIRPDHLELLQRGDHHHKEPTTLAAINSAKTHCPAGHEYIASNIKRRYNRPNSRECLTCHRIRERNRGKI
jgi:hypothetical protein